MSNNINIYIVAAERCDPNQKDQPLRPLASPDWTFLLSEEARSPMNRLTDRVIIKMTINKKRRRCLTKIDHLKKGERYVLAEQVQVLFMIVICMHTHLT